MKKIWITPAVFFLGFSLYGQFVQDYLKAADAYFRKADYASAAAYYEKYFSKDDRSRAGFSPYAPQSGKAKKDRVSVSRGQALYQLAESYRLLNYPEKAAAAYRQVLEEAKEEFPLAGYYYGTMLRALAQYAGAEAALKDFLAGYTASDDYRRQAEREVANLQFIQKELARKDLKYYSVAKGPAGLNATGASYAPALLNSSVLLFTSTRPLDSTAQQKEYTNRLYQAQYAGGNFSSVEMAGIDQPRNTEQGVASVSPDGRLLFLTRWTGAADKKSAAIYRSTRNGDQWSEPVRLGENVNAPGFNAQQPFFSTDGKYLFFSSNRSGSIGGYDIWYTELDAQGEPGVAMNCGPEVNTAYDEQAPYYHQPSGTLVFASNGRVGMGGFDLFQSKGTPGKWTLGENFGYPVNSVKDDLYFLSRGGARNILEDAWLSSDRDAACCLELFSVRKVRPMRQISGTVVSCDGSKLLPGAVINIVDPVTSRIVFSGKVGADGNYQFTLEDYQPLMLKATAEGFLPGSLKIELPADTEAEKMEVARLCLVPEPPKVNETFVVENVFYEYNKAQVKPESYPALDEIVRMLKTYPDMAIQINGHTDNIGSDSYNQKLSEARAQAVVAYLVSHGIARERLSARGFGESMPVAPNTKEDGSDNPEGREKNRRTEFKVIRN